MVQRLITLVGTPASVSLATLSDAFARRLTALLQLKHNRFGDVQCLQTTSLTVYLILGQSKWISFDSLPILLSLSYHSAVCF